MPGNHTKSRRIHSKRRALSRYAIELNNKDLQAIAMLIQKSQGTHIKTDSLTKSEWIVAYKDKTLRLIYCKKSKSIVTFLPPLHG